MKRKEKREKEEASKNPERVKAHIEELKSGKNLSRARKDEIHRLQGYVTEAETAAAKEKASQFDTRFSMNCFLISYFTQESSFQ